MRFNQAYFAQALSALHTLPYHLFNLWNGEEEKGGAYKPQEGQGRFKSDSRRSLYYSKKSTALLQKSVPTFFSLIIVSLFSAPLLIHMCLNIIIW